MTNASTLSRRLNQAGFDRRTARTRGFTVSETDQGILRVGDNAGQLDRITAWLYSHGFETLHGDQAAVIATPAGRAPRYVTRLLGAVHQVYDRIHGYALLGEHPSPGQAWQAARQLNGDPGTAAAAVLALDAAQCGPAAEGRRTIRRWGYQGAIVQAEARDFHAWGRWSDWVGGGHLRMMWSRAGLPFYVTPERYAALPLVWLEDEGETFPATELDQLTRRRVQVEAMPSYKRYAPCELHGIATHNCAICAPVESWECGWGGCRANAVTTVGGRRTCERCLRLALDLTAHDARRSG